MSARYMFSFIFCVDAADSLSRQKIVAVIGAEHNMKLEQMDVKTAFLHGSLDEKIYMKQPDGFIEIGQEDKVCLLQRSLYGLKQSPR